MPGMDGYATIVELKENSATSHIPVIFVTSLNREEDEARGLALGAVDYIAKPFNPSLMRARIGNHIELKRHRDNLQAMVNERTIEIVTRLVHVAESRDTDTGMHIRRICEYSRLLARESGLSPRIVETIAQASAMHDIGKVGIPDAILLKPGRLEPEEWKIMQGHSVIGYENLKGSSSKLLQTGCEIALTHHERWDGTGYPHGLKGEEIPISGRIVCIADVFDALVTRRPYKEAWPLDKAFGLIEAERGKHFDPELADIFLQNREAVQEIRRMYEDKDTN
jgi:putative two-component system response regulator